jgi:hypothetical protein
MRLDSTTTWWRLVCLALCWMNCKATIRIVESGREFRSWPDHKLGPQLADGAVYKARLQQIQGNSHLCFAEFNWNVTVPDDGLPGTSFLLHEYRVISVMECDSANVLVVYGLYGNFQWLYWSNKVYAVMKLKRNLHPSIFGPKGWSSFLSLMGPTMTP